MDDKELKRLIAESQKTLADFLKADLRLGLTFAQLARTEADMGDVPAAIHACKKVCQVLDAVARFLPRAVSVSPEDRKQIETDFNRLKELLAELESAPGGPVNH